LIRDRQRINPPGIAHHQSTFFAEAASREDVPVMMIIYSAMLNFVVSSGGKWIIGAPYAMKAANDLHVNMAGQCRCTTRPRRCPI
jgi:short subunit fatty acids transporter